MAGLIRREDVDAVRERARIDDVVSAHVTLKPAGVGSLKGLCPFHDERTPSFHVRPGVGRWHCFGCGEGGDVISFVQKIDGLGFAEAVEYLAERVGVQLRYEDAGREAGPRRSGEPGQRRRLLEAHRVAAEFYAEQLLDRSATIARSFLAERSFDRADAERFGVGYAPAGWDNLQRHLQGKGFTQAELTAAGLVSQGRRGIYDRFRGRLMWPIRDATGDVIGFGARRLFEEDNGPKYLNTPETTLYKKSQVLYGIDLAKRDIARERRAVVVEGYTDVMAAHLSGVTTAVATCGTAFGGDHARVVRRLLGDTSAGGGLQLASGASLGGEVIFTFDGDEAGKKAALRAFGEDQRFYAQTFVAVEPEGMDPCELRMAHGPEAVRALVDGRQPLFEFVIRTTLSRFDLNTVEGRVAAMRESAPVVAGIRDVAWREDYARQLAGWIGTDERAVRREIVHAAERVGRGDRSAHGSRAATASSRGETAAGDGPGRSQRAVMPDLRDPMVRVESEVLALALQSPHAVPAYFDGIGTQAFHTPVWRGVYEAIAAAGGIAVAAQITPSQWVARVSEAAPEVIRDLVTELAVAPLPEDRENAVGDYADGILRALLDQGLARQVADARSRLQRMDPVRNAEEYAQAWSQLVELENQRRELRESA